MNSPRIVPAILVGVVADRAALLRATRLRRPPDLFELRLDALRHDQTEIERALPKLRAPLILTARHPAEGGLHALSVSERRSLLQRYLEHAQFIDIELRSVSQMQPLLAEARRHQLSLIISSHDLRGTPPPAVLREQLECAIGFGADIFKVATRTESAAQLARLLSFFEENSDRFPVAAMGMGSRGAGSRRLLLRAGSALNYAAVGASNAPGQLTLGQLRRTRAAYKR